MTLLRAEVHGRTYHMGRIPSVWDRRNYLIEDVFEIKHPPHTKLWEPGPNLDQASTPSCTGHAARGWELALPIADRVDANEAAAPDPRATEIWSRAQVLEFGHADPNNGATIHGIAKALHEVGPLAVNGKPRMRSYVFARTMGGALHYMSYRGPLILGIAWYNSMFTPGPDGILNVDHGSGLAGGHAIVAYGLDMERSLIRVRNSWGRGWGVEGDFFLTFDSFKSLCFDDFGEVCAGVEQAVDVAP